MVYGLKLFFEYENDFHYCLMIEKIIEKNGEKVVEVRSDGGKLLFIKTKTGYEMKCPRTKMICVVSYEEMLKDCFACLEQNCGEDFVKLFNKSK